MSYPGAGAARPALGMIEGLVLRPGARDVAPLAVPVLGSLGRFAGDLLAAHAAGPIRFGIVTGAYLAWADPPAADTDGPVGVAALARLCAALDIPTVVITDELCSGVVRACLDHVGLAAGLRVVPQSATPAEIQAAAAGWGLTHLLAVERLGPARDGRAHTMRGLDHTHVTAPLHVLFSEPGRTTAAIGDGGNEVGMGVLPADLVAAYVANGAAIACTVPVDHLIVAGTSNWGCFALIATLAVLEPSCAPVATTLLDPPADARLVEIALAAGAIDGVRGESVASVDGIPLNAYAPLLDALRSIVTMAARGARGTRRRA